MNQKSFLFTILWVFGFAFSAMGQTSSSWNLPQSNPMASGWSPPATNTVSHSSSFSNDSLTFPEPAKFDPAVAQANFKSIQEFKDSAPTDQADSLGSLASQVADSSKGLLSAFSGDGDLATNFKSLFEGIDVGRMLGSLSLVLGLYFGFVWLVGKFQTSGPKTIPAEVVEVLGHKPFGPNQNLQLVRLGSKLLLLMNGPDGIQPIGEITEPGEVDYLASLCSGRKAISQPTAIAAIQSAANQIQDSLTRKPTATPSPLAASAPNSTPTRLSDVLRVLENSTGANFEA